MEELEALKTSRALWWSIVPILLILAALAGAHANSLTTRIGVIRDKERGQMGKDIQTNKDSIVINDGRIEANKGDIDTLTGEVDTLTLQVAEIGDGVGKIDKAVKESQTEGAEAVKELLAQTTGGDSYLKLELRNLAEDPNYFRLKGFIVKNSIHQGGDYNMKEVSITIHANKTKLYDSRQPAETLHAGTDISFKNTPTEFVKFPVPKSSEAILYSLQIIAKNGKYFQYILFKKFNNKWYSHAVYYNDLYQQEFFGEEFYPYDYPETLKSTTPRMEELINYTAPN